MEISDSSIGVFHMVRIVGLAPYVIQRDKRGYIHIQRSIVLVIYSLALVTVLASLTYNGLLFDAKSKVPIRPSFRMKSATSKVVTAVDVSVVVLATLSGVGCSIVGLHHAQDLSRRLKEADDILSLYTDEIKDRKRNYALMVGGMMLVTVMLGLDIWSWHRIANSMTRADEPSPQLNVQWYIPFYGLYYILMGLHIQFAQTAFGLGRRYRRLNLALKYSFQEDIKLSSLKGGPSIMEVSAMNTISGKIVPSSTKWTSPSTLLMANAPNQKKMSSNDKIINGNGGVSLMAGNINSKQYIIERLAYTHESLGDGMSGISGAFGVAVLCMLTSCLLHLVATSYFLFLDWLVQEESRVSWLQALWILFHIIRLLLIVEPCHITYVESKRTISIVSKIQRNCKDEQIGNRMEKFWQQLVAGSANFSACGMCTIDRQILTSFSGAIATYLVILIQFQKTDG